MKKMTTKLLIELKSDLCAGSGFSYAGVIDRDVSYNKNGIPYISGRRLKGCMKEAAKLIGLHNEELEVFFGKDGENENSGISVGDAFPQGWIEIDQEIERLKQNKSVFSEYINHEAVLELFTGIKAQTKIDDNGAAEENSLRFTRVVEKNDPLSEMDNPLSKKELTFEAPISFCYQESEGNWFETLKNIANATRHIGTMRNRGMGNVRLKISEEELKISEEDKTLDDADKIRVCDHTTGETEKIIISYRMVNQNPLMLSGSSDSRSEKYISGTSVMGAFAKEYLKRGTPKDDTFYRLFLNGDTCFSNMTLTKKWEQDHNQKWVAYYPAPLYINRLKKTKKLVNVTVSNKEDKSEYCTKNGNMPRRLKNQLLGRYEDIYDVTEPTSEIIYHYSTVKKKDSDDGTLYFLEALEAGQRFCGTIIADRDLKDCILTILRGGVFYFGKSKSAQYGRCEVESDSITAEDYKPADIGDVKKGDAVIVTLQSDAIFIRECDGSYTVQADEVRRCIGKQLGMSEEEISAEGIDASVSYLQTKEITGYNTVWNLKKQAIPAIRAGSAFVFTLKNDLKNGSVNCPRYIGERTLEGFGQCDIKVVDLANASYALKDRSDQEKNQEKKNEEIKDNKEIEEQEKIEERKRKIETEKKELSLCLRKVLERSLLNKILLYLGNQAADEKRFSSKMTATQIGRIELMLAEAENTVRLQISQNKIKASDYDIAALRDFVERINSIQSKETKTEAANLLDKMLGVEIETVLKQNKEKQATHHLYACAAAAMTTSKTKQSDKLEEYERLISIVGQTEADKQVFSLWTEYAYQVLTYQKYWKKEDKTGKGEGKTS